MKMEHELNLLRLSKRKKERNEMSYLKNKYQIFDKNRFSLNDETRNLYTRNLEITKKLLKLIPRNFNKPFQIYIKNVKKERIKYSQNKIFIKHICNINSIPDDLKNIIIEYL